MADKEIKYSGAWKTCEDCGCVLFLEYPSNLCPACEAKQKAIAGMGKTAAMVKENSITPESVETAKADYAESLKAEGKGK